MTVTAAARDRGLNRAARAIEANTDHDYNGALGMLIKASAETPHLTLAAVLADEGIHNLEAIDRDLTTLDRADTVKRAAYAAAAAKDTDHVTPSGNVRLDAEPEEVARWLRDPVAGEARYRTARGFDPRYQHPETGRAAFDADERTMLDANVDLVASLGRSARLAANLAPAQRLARQLERAWTAGSDPGERVRLLDAAVSAHRQELRLLDQATPAPDRVRLHGRMLLDQGDTNDRGRALAAAVEARLAAENRPWGDFMMVLDQMLAA
jgi:hypothetical protein